MTRRAGIFAAGVGGRLREGSAIDTTPKPLVQVGGRPLIDRVLTSVAETEPVEVVIIVNDAATAVREHVSALMPPFPIRWIVETTPSSMHSFLLVVEALTAGGDAGPFLMSTVDTIAPAGAYAAFASKAEALDADVVLAITRQIDDDTPLLVEMAPGTAQVVSIGAGTMATAGYYVVQSSVLAEADAARGAGITALRVFLARLLALGYRIAAVEVPAGVDVDRPDDVLAAEAFLKQVSV